MPYVLPSALYPQKQFILPNIMSQQEVTQLFAAPLTLKEYCVIGLLYGSGLRISEVAALRIPDIESAAKRIKVVQSLPRYLSGGALPLIQYSFYLYKKLIESIKWATNKCYKTT